MSPPAKTVRSENSRLPLGFRRSRDVINAVLVGSPQSQEPLLRLLVNIVRKADTSLLKVTLPAMHVQKAMEVMRDLETA